jgi:hypothetical protein
MLKLKAEEMGGKEGIMWSFIICTACLVVGYQRTLAKCVRNVACMGMNVILNSGKESIQMACVNMGG